MFYLLCSFVVLAVMFLVYAATTLATLPALPLISGISTRVRAATAANLLFTVRALPLLVSLIASLGLALPAFLEFEPHSTHENPGPALLLLGASGLLVTLGVLLRTGRILRLTRALEHRWLANAGALKTAFQGIPVYRVNHSGSLVAVTGLFKPRIFVSRDVADLLSQEEFEAALAHELAHVRASDNLRNFVLKLTSGPKLFRQIDSLWVGASELAADERAIAQGASAMDLSSALVKVGRLSLDRHPQMLAASHLVDQCSSATQMRAARLRDLLNGNTLHLQAHAAAHPGLRWIGFAGLSLICYLLALGALLPNIHEALEFFVRY